MRFVQNALNAVAGVRNPEVFAMALSATGMAIIFFATLWLLATPALHSDFRYVQATLARFEQVRSNEGPKGHPEFQDMPVVRFQDEGQEVEARVANLALPPRPFEVGQKIDVMYRPGAPREVWIPNVVEFYFFPVFFGSIGALVWYVGARLFEAIRRKQGG